MAEILALRVVVSLKSRFLEIVVGLCRSSSFKGFQLSTELKV